MDGIYLYMQEIVKLKVVYFMYSTKRAVVTQLQQMIE